MVLPPPRPPHGLQDARHLSEEQGLPPGAAGGAFQHGRHHRCAHLLLRHSSFLFHLLDRFPQKTPSAFQNRTQILDLGSAHPKGPAHVGGVRTLRLPPGSIPQWGSGCAASPRRPISPPSPPQPPPSSADPALLPPPAWGAARMRGLTLFQKDPSEWGRVAAVGEKGDARVSCALGWGGRHGDGGGGRQREHAQAAAAPPPRTPRAQGAPPGCLWGAPRPPQVPYNDATGIAPCVSPALFRFSPSWGQKPRARVAGGEGARRFRAGRGRGAPAGSKQRPRNGRRVVACLETQRRCPPASTQQEKAAPGPSARLLQPGGGSSSQRQ